MFSPSLPPTTTARHEFQFGQTLFAKLFCHNFAEAPITFAEKKNLDMTEVITQIPGYENGTVKRISASVFSAPIIVSEIAIDLRDKWKTKVLCISLDERKDLIESFITNNGTNPNAIETIVLDQKNPDVSVVIKKASGIIHRKFVRAVIISGAERLKLKQPSSDEKGIIDRWLERMAKAERIPLVLVESNKTPIVL